MAGSQENVNVERRPVSELLRQFASNVSEHHTLLAAAGVAYFFALALVPAVVTIVSIYGLVAEPYEVAEQLEPLTDALPDEAEACSHPTSWCYLDWRRAGWHQLGYRALRFDVAGIIKRV